MSSSLRVNTIVPSTGTNVAIGTANGTVTFTDSVNFVLGTGSSIFSPASNTLTFGTNDAERLRIDSSGNVGINVVPTNYSNYTTLALSDTTGSTIEGRVSGVLKGSLTVDSQVTLNAVAAIPLVFKTTNSERARITSDGKVRLPDNGKLTLGAGDDLQIYHNGSQNLILSASGQVLETRADTFQVTNSAGTENLLQANGDGAVNLYHDGTKRFETLSNGTQTTGRVYLNGTNGGLDYNNIAHTLEYLVNGSTHSELNTGSYVPAGTKNLGANAHRWQTLYLSNGIDFASTSDASGMISEVLDDYEEGTFTPTIEWGGTSATLTGGTYGRYTKIGNTVIINFRIIQSARNATSGSIRMYGLPYNEGSPVNYNHGMVQMDSGGNMPSGAGSIMLYFSNNNVRFLYQTNTAHSDLDASHCVDGTAWYGFGTYFTS